MNTEYSKFQLHPWHGVKLNPDTPEMLTAYIEIVPTDTVKYEIDKESGLLKIDRPQKFSMVVPALYGFLPKTYCGKRVAEYCMNKSGKTNIKGDGDPLDILVLTEKNIPNGNILVQAIPVCGLRMIDNNEADDKIIAVLKDDALFSHWNKLSDLPQSLIDRLKHYFLSYKDMPGNSGKKVIIDSIYDAGEAKTVIQASIADYEELISS